MEHIQMLPLASVPKKPSLFAGFRLLFILFVFSGVSLPEQPISRSQCPEKALFNPHGLGGSCRYHTFLSPGLTGQGRSYGAAVEKRVLGKFLCSE